MAEEQRDELIQLRRDFHRYPETSWLEMRTSAKIAEYLTELGMEVLTGKNVCREEARIGVPDPDILERHFSQVKEQGAPARFLTEELEQGYTGVVGILRCGEGPTVALRFDIDALPMEEAEDLEHRPFREGFSSQNPGMMHACGHDCHAAIGLGTARILSALRDQLHGTVKFLFQPGEEGTKGAYAMVENGHLDGIDYFAGTHVAPDDKEDDGDITPGTYGSLATCKYNVFFHGQAAHAGGFPEEGKNAVLAAAHAAVGLSGIARHSQGISRVNVGVIRGGSNSNVVADEAMISMEVRGETDEINQYMDRRAKEICQAAAMMEECSCEMRLMGRAPSQVSSPELIDRISNLVRNHLPQYRVSSNPNAKNWGSEDIGFMMNRVQEQGGQAVYMRTMTKMASPQHTVRFDVNEDVLVKGAVSFSAIVCDLLKKN
ncbi:amidohydrolase [Clostridiaceae bacterium Marseille-Q3526]|nr:amidohydrolase [Clostridiaceae bacterium Marseille-Q3526]